MKIIHKYKNFIFSLMWIGVLINFNSHFNDIIKIYNIFYAKVDNIYNIVNIFDVKLYNQDLFPPFGLLTIHI